VCQRRGADENGAEFFAAEQVAPVGIDVHSVAGEGFGPRPVDVTDRDHVRVG